MRAIDDSTPERFRESKAADDQVHERIANAKRLFDLWTAEPLGLARARHEATDHGMEIFEGVPSKLAAEAESLTGEARVLHWPLAFA